MNDILAAVLFDTDNRIRADIINKYFLKKQLIPTTNFSEQLWDSDSLPAGWGAIDLKTAKSRIQEFLNTGLFPSKITFFGKNNNSDYCHFCSRTKKELEELTKKQNGLFIEQNLWETLYPQRQLKKIGHTVHVCENCIASMLKSVEEEAWKLEVDTCNQIGDLYLVAPEEYRKRGLNGTIGLHSSDSALCNDDRFIFADYEQKAECYSCGREKIYWDITELNNDILGTEKRNAMCQTCIDIVNEKDAEDELPFGDHTLEANRYKSRRAISIKGIYLNDADNIEKEAVSSFKKRLNKNDVIVFYIIKHNEYSTNSYILTYDIYTLPLMIFYDNISFKDLPQKATYAFEIDHEEHIILNGTPANNFIECRNFQNYIYNKYKK